MTDGTMYQVWVRKSETHWEALPYAYDCLEDAQSFALSLGVPTRIVEIRAIMCL